jgi:hypothetical protein
VVRKLIAKLSMLTLAVLLTSPLNACSNEGYVKLYNYTESELQLYLDGRLYGQIPPSVSPTWVPTSYGMHKVEVYKTGCYRVAYKYCEVSYSYPNAWVEFGRYDL